MLFEAPEWPGPGRARQELGGLWLLSKVLTGIRPRMCLVLPLATLLGHPWGLGQYLSPSHPLQPGLQSPSGCLVQTWNQGKEELGAVPFWRWVGSPHLPQPETSQLQICLLQPCSQGSERLLLAIQRGAGQKGSGTQGGHPVSFSKGQVLPVSPG